jgi:hypothetical protein
MRKLIFAINTTLDGWVDHTKHFVDEEKLEYFTHLNWRTRIVRKRDMSGMISFPLKSFL